MKTIEEIRGIIAQHKDELKAKFNVKGIAVFGSYARGEQKKRGSDVDILVEFEKPIGLFEFMDLEERLSNLLGIRVDLVSKKALKPVIGQHILREVVYL